MDKRGLSLTSLTEAVICILLILFILAFVVIGGDQGMNSLYNQTYNSTFGLTQVTETQNSLNSYQEPLKNGLGSDPTTNAVNGVNLVGSWGMIYSGIQIMLGFVTGGFIQNAIGLMQLGQAGFYLGWALRLLFIFGIAFIIIKILFKVKP
jgi:hypothetical protein